MDVHKIIDVSTIPRSKYIFLDFTNFLNKSDLKIQVELI